VASHILGDFVFILGNNILGKKNLDKGEQKNQKTD
jgi:hypothetical protein